MAQNLFSSKTARFLALLAPSFPTDRLRRGAPPERPLVLYEKTQNALRVFSCDRLAQAGGVYPGQPLAEARAILPGLEAAPADPEADARAFRKLALTLLRYAPFVGASKTGEAVLDISGGAHLFGGEAALLGDLVARLGKAGIAARAAIASTPGAAFAAAFASPQTIAPEGDARAFLEPLPVEALRLDEACTDGLRRLGLKRIGQLYELPRAPLAARFGPMLLRRLDQALGEEEEPIEPIEPPPDYATEARTLEPMTAAAEIETALARLARALEKRLERGGVGARRFELALFGVDHRIRRIVVGCGRPARRAGHVTRLFRNRIEAVYDAREAGFGYDMARLSAYGAERMEAAQAGFDVGSGLVADPPLAPPFQGGEEKEHPPFQGGKRRVTSLPPLEKGGPGGDPPRAQATFSPPTDSLSALQDVLASRLGAARVLRPALLNAHLPEKASAFIPAAAPLPAAPATRAERPLLLLPRPEPIEAVAAVPDGAPVRFSWRRVRYPVVRARGPERIAADWFAAKKPAPTRDYYALEDAEGRRWWVFREGIYGRETAAPQWFLHGLFS